MTTAARLNAIDHRITVTVEHPPYWSGPAYVISSPMVTLPYEYIFGGDGYCRANAREAYYLIHRLRRMYRRAELLRAMGTLSRAAFYEPHLQEAAA